MKVVLDTSVIDDDLGLEADQASRLVRNTHVAGVDLIIPEVVEAEMQDHLRARIAEAQKQLRGVPRRAAEAAGLAVTTDAFHRASSELRSRLMEVASIAPFPEISHEEVLVRMMEGRRPFRPRQSQEAARKHGKVCREKGYKDFLIWQTVVTLAAEGHRVAFVSGNTRDYEGDAQGELHDDLLEDLRRRGIPESRVALYRSLNDFFRLVIAPNLPPGEAKLSEMFPEGNYIRVLNETLDALIPGMFQGQDNPVELDLPPEAEPPFLPRDWTFDFEPSQVLEDSSGGVLVEVVARVSTYVEFSVHPGLVAGFTSRHVYNLQHNLFDEYLQGEIEETYKVTASLTLDAASGKVASASIVDVEVWR